MGKIPRRVLLEDLAILLESAAEESETSFAGVHDEYIYDDDDDLLAYLGSGGQREHLVPVALELLREFERRSSNLYLDQVSYAQLHSATEELASACRAREFWVWDFFGGDDAWVDEIVDEVTE